VPAVLPHQSPLSLPWTLGQLRVTAAQLEGRKRSDSFHLTVIPTRSVGIVLLDLRVSALEPKPKPELARLRSDLTNLAIEGLCEGTPLHAIVLDLVRKLFESPLSQLGATLIRCSPIDARVEIMTAGMPPVVCAEASGQVTLHGKPAPPLTALSHAPPPVEQAPLIWGSSWLASSDGFSANDDQAQLMERLAGELDLSSAGLSLSQESPAALRDLLTKLPCTSGRSERDDATLVLLAADPSARLQSGIKSR
jgi:hypothetical protein